CRRRSLSDVGRRHEGRESRGIVPRDDGTHADVLQVDRSDHRRWQRGDSHADEKRREPRLRRAGSLSPFHAAGRDRDAVLASPLMSTLRTDSLTKSYGGRTVVKGVSLDVNSGEVVGLLGPNGAGKTTTFYMTVGLTQPDSGRVF